MKKLFKLLGDLAGNILGGATGGILSGATLGTLKDLVSLFLERRVVVSKGKQEVAVAQAKAEALATLKLAETEAYWEQTQAVNSKSSWKDEYWTIVLSIPLFLIWPKVTRDWVIDGFTALNAVPEWYLYFLGVSILTSFGIKPTAQYFLSKKVGVK